ncbi:MAG: phosphatase PAP2 family protein [Lachnospiraceae bacterium]|nr:phosphatase PAP2 family protein [Lachnospiraceae bacterium]
MFYWDWELAVLEWFNSIHNAFLDVFMPLVTKLGDAGIFWIILTLVLLIIPKTRHLGLASFIALVLDIILCNGILKPIVIRCRPGWLMFFESGPDWIRQLEMLVSFPNDFSFPSGHTAASFASATALFATLKNKYKWWGVGALCLALLIGISRLYVCVHWPTDVIGGMIVGIICGIAGWAIAKPLWKVINKKLQQFKEKRFAKDLDDKKSE